MTERDDGFLDSVATPLLVSNLMKADSTALEGRICEQGHLCERMCKIVNAANADIVQLKNCGTARALIHVLHRCSSEGHVSSVLKALVKLLEHTGPLGMSLVGDDGMCAGVIECLKWQEKTPPVQEWGIRAVNALCCLEPSMREELGQRGACKVVANFLRNFGWYPYGPGASMGCSAVLNLAADCAKNVKRLTEADAASAIGKILEARRDRDVRRLGWKALRTLVEGGGVSMAAASSWDTTHMEAAVHNELGALVSGRAKDRSESSVATVLAVVAALAEDSDTNRYALRFVEAPAAVFVALRMHASSREVQKHGWRIVAALAIRDISKFAFRMSDSYDWEAQEEIAREAEAWKRAGVCRLAVTALQLPQKVTWDRVLAAALRAVANLASRSKVLRKGLREAGVCKYIVLTLLTWKSRRATVMHACNALVNMVSGDTVLQEAAGSEGACEALIEVLIATEATSKVQEWAWKAAMELVKDCAANRKRFEAAGICDCALAALKAQSASRNVQLWVVLVIAGLSEGSAANRAALGRLGACEEVVRALGGFKLAKEVEAGLLAIGSLIDSNEENRQRFLQLKTHAIVATALSNLGAAAAIKPEFTMGLAVSAAQLGANVLAALGDSAQDSCASAAVAATPAVDS